MLLYVHRNRRLIRDVSPGRPPRLSHSSGALTTLLTPTHIEPESFESRWNVFFFFFFFFFFPSLSFLLFFFFFLIFFLPGVDASHVYVGTWMLGCLHSLIGPQTFRRALTASVDSCREIQECPFSGVTSSGRVWSSRCRKAMLGVWVSLNTASLSCLTEIWFESGQVRSIYFNHSSQGKSAN